MRMNPVFREGVQVYLMEGDAFVAYFFLLIILALVEFLTLFLSSYDSQIWMGPAYLFKVSSISALILIVYFGSRIADQEFVPWKFFPLKRWLRQEGISVSELASGQIALLGLHAFLLVLSSAPLLIWAGAIARASASTLACTFFLLFFYTFAYGVWGLVAVPLWENRIESRQVFVRFFFIFFVFLSAFIYVPLNPIAFLLSYLGREKAAPLALWGWKLSVPAAHFLFHFFLLASSLLIYRWALRRKAMVD